MCKSQKIWLLWIACGLMLIVGCSGNGSGATNDPASGAGKEQTSGDLKPPLKPDKKDAVAAMKRFNVNMGYDDAGRVVSLDFSSTNATNPWLKNLSGLPNVERLNLRNTEVSDSGMKYVAGLGRLAQLRLPESITNAGLEQLKDLRFLEELYLDNAAVTGSGLEVLKDSKHLRVLVLSNTAVADDGLTHLAGMSQLEWLNLSGTQVTDRGLARLQLLPKLKTLNLFLLSGVTDEGIKKLASMKSLIEVDLGFTGVTDAGVAELEKSLPTAKISH